MLAASRRLTFTGRKLRRLKNGGLTGSGHRHCSAQAAQERQQFVPFPILSDPGGLVCFSLHCSVKRFVKLV